MLGRNHMVSAGAAWVFAAPHLLDSQLNTVSSIGLMLVVLFSSLLPDIDHPESILGKRVKFISVPMSILQGDKSFMPWNEDKHSRGITHSIWAISGCFYLMLSNFDPVWVAFAFGFCAHICGDASTPAGVALFFPLKTKVRMPIIFRTGGIVEYLLTYTLAILALSELLGKSIIDKLIIQLF